MTAKRNFYIVVSVLVILVLIVNVLNGLYVLRESSRDETWHEQAVAGADSVSLIEWRTVRSQRPLVEWTLTTPGPLTYLVQLLDDRRYISAVFSGAAGDAPRQYSKGRISKEDSDVIMEMLEVLYAKRETLFSEENKTKKDAVLRYSRNNAHPITFRYNTGDFANVVSELREFDARLFVALGDSLNYAPRGYSREQPKVSYSVDDLPALMSGLNSARESAYPSLIERLVTIGKPSETYLIEALRNGRDKRYLPISRYLAIMDGLEKLADRDSDGFTLVRAVAKEPASLPGRIQLKQHAQKIVDRLDTSAYIDEYWAVNPDALKRFAPTTLSGKQARELQHLIERLQSRQKTERADALAALIDIGDTALPELLKQTQNRSFKYYNGNELVNAVAAIGHSDAIIYAIRDLNLQPVRAVKPLEQIGAKGVSALLLLLESPDYGARVQAHDVLIKEPYNIYSTQFSRHLKRCLDIAQSADSAAVQSLQRMAMVGLIDVMRRHKLVDEPAILELTNAAIGTRVPDEARIAALNALGALGPNAISAVETLRSRVGYEDGKVYRAMSDALEKISVTRVEPH